MHGCIRRIAIVAFVFAACLLAASPALGQFPGLEDPPKLYAPAKPATQRERDRRAALHHYVLGLLYERDDRLLDALKQYQESVRLDPEAPAVFKAQVPILVAQGRGDAALEACKKALALDAEDHAAWYAAARLHKAMGQFPQAQKALERGLATASIKEHPETAQQLWLDLGGLHELAGAIEPAVRAFSAAAAILDHPDALLEHGGVNREAVVARSVETYERIGDLQRRAKRYPEAIAAYHQAQQRAPEATAARLSFTLAQLCAEQNRLQEALDHCDAYLRRQPLGVEPYEMRVALLTKLGRQNDIVPWLEEAAGKDRFNIGVRTLLAKECLRAGRLDQAEKAFLALANEAPSADMYRGLFDVYRAAKTPERALPLVNAAVTLAGRKPAEPGSAHATLQARAILTVLRGDRELAADLVRAAVPSERSRQLSFEGLHFLAVLADHQRQLPEAERLYRQALALAPADQQSVVHAGLFRVLWKGRNYDAVLAHCREGLAKTEGAAQLVFHIEHAKVLARGDRHGEALQAVELAMKAATVDQRFAVEHLRVRILAQAERFQEAETTCQELLKQHVLPSDQQEIRYLLSNVYNAWKKLPECEQQLTSILRADPDNATANNDLGYIWADHNKNLDEAEAMIRKALDLDREQRKRAGLDVEDNAAYVDSLGWVLFRRGKIEEALRELERAAKLPEGDDPVIWDHLGDVYRHLMRMDEARTAWRRAVELYDQNRRKKSDEKYRELQRKLER